MTRDELHSLVAERLGVEPDSLTGDANLVQMGRESLTVMRIVNQLKRAGATVRYSDLISRPTLDSWWQNVSQGGNG
ncbi:phosphopantetheine-binding protein [Streptomyces pinistramenti]|uniref:phosphopantetheine-binding protein n=1 Tax=Streptomyces pinistramenti TaxID=2884812 RepID=UPI001D06A5DE|nr:phosphopantetheine-binding protein [Streptomyces pinistramenti]MCB5908126.1 phosphopantetheine-binding protein [Streptomyces pinistramenti]